jgi:thiol-disulfide isomerase/thioredoxin
MSPPRSLLLVALMLCAGGLQAQQPAPAESNSGQRALLESLFAPGSSQDELLKRAKAADQAGLPRQQVIEAKLVWGLRNQDGEWLMKIAPELEMLAKSFEPAEAIMLKSRDEARAFIVYAKALKAEQEGNEAEFKANLLEAFWMAPTHASLFAETRERQRRSASMASLRIDMQAPLALSNGETTTLAEQVAGKKGLLIDFWASWCGPCMKLMPALRKKALQLQPSGIVVAGMNKDDENAASVAERIRQEQAMEIPWMIEPAERPLTKLLGIESIPRMVLINPEGQVLFNGHPEDPSLWKALSRLNPGIKAP